MADDDLLDAVRNARDDLEFIEKQPLDVQEALEAEAWERITDAMKPPAAY